MEFWMKKVRIKKEVYRNYPEIFRIMKNHEDAGSKVPA